MQFHPLAYMVKLKIEMSMAELIAKIARKKERLPTIHTSSQSQRYTISSPLRSFTRSGTHQVQPLPPARNAVPFRVWNGSLPTNLSSSGHGSARVTPLQSASSASAARASANASAVDLELVPGNDLYMVQEVTVESEVVQQQHHHDTTVGSSFMLPVLPDRRFPPTPPDTAYHHDDDDDDDGHGHGGGHDNNNDNNLLLYDILPVLLPDGRLPPPEGMARQLPSDDGDSMREVEPPVIWDGNPMMMSSTVVASGTGAAR